MKDNLQTKLFICPVCGNIIVAGGNASIACCGVSLLPAVAKETDEAHEIDITPTEDEYFLRTAHEMSKEHYISFVAYFNSERYEVIKLYPEGNAECRIRLRRIGEVYLYCNRHGLMKIKAADLLKKVKQ